jgi:predicted DNA-binding antitoxin AbrB/MazE fold protein
MSQQFQAVFENGILRPLEPLPLRDQERVIVSIEGPAAANDSGLDEEMSPEQKRTVLDLIERLEQSGDFRPSAETKDRVAELIHKEKTASLSPDEVTELNQYMQIEHFMRLAKASKHLDGV